MAIPGLASRLMVVVALVSTMTALNGIPAKAAGWGDPQPVGPWGTDANKILALDATTVLATFATNDGHLGLRRSVDGGRTWSARTVVGIREDSSYDVAGAGRAVDVVWLSSTTERHPTSRVRYVRSSDRGRTFSAPVTLSKTSSNAISTAVARDPDGHVIVAWIEDSGAGEEAVHSLHVRTSLDGGRTFAADSVIAVASSVSGAREAPPAVVIEGGVAYLAYYLGSSNILRLRRSANRGATWSAATTISRHAYSWPRPVVTAFGDTVYVGYRSRGAMVYRRSIDAGLSWSEKLTLFSKYGWSLTMNAYETGVDAVYIQAGSGWWQFSTHYRHSADGRTWSRVARIGGSWMSPSLAFASSRSFLLYSQWNGGDVGKVTRAAVLTKRR